MHQRGLPHRFSDGGNRVMLGAPLVVRIAGCVRVAREQAGPDTGHRDDVVRRDRSRASGGRPQERGQADREKHQATHEPILTCHRDTVKRCRAPMWRFDMDLGVATKTRSISRIRRRADVGNALRRLCDASACFRPQSQQYVRIGWLRASNVHR